MLRPEEVPVALQEYSPPASQSGQTLRAVASGYWSNPAP
jgi:hypothetical protein